MKNIKTISSVILIVTVLVLTYVYTNRDKIFKPAHNGEYTSFQQDLQTIRDIKVNPDQLYRAMIRLGKVQNDESRVVALEFVKNNNPMLRAAAYESLGFYSDDKVLKILSEGLVDSDKIVRLATIRGMGRQPTQSRINVLMSRLGEKDVSNYEKIEIYATLGRIGGQTEVELAVKALIAIANADNKQENTDAAFRVAGIAASDPRVIQLYRNKLHSKDERLMAFAIRHLSAIHDRDALKNLRNYSHHATAEIRVSAVQSAALACAPDRWEIFSELIKNEKSPQVLQAIIRAPAMILDEKSAIFLQDIIAAAQVAPELIDLAKKTLNEVEQNKKNERCK